MKKIRASFLYGKMPYAITISDIYEDLFQSARSVRDDYVIHLGAAAKLLRKRFFGFFNEGGIEFFLHQVDGATAKASTHDARACDATIESQIVQEIQLFAAHFIQLAHPVVSLIHLLANGFIVAFFKGIAHVEHTLYFLNDVFCAFVGSLLR